MKVRMTFYEQGTEEYLFEIESMKLIVSKQEPIKPPDPREQERLDGRRAT